jgi:cbb3-type cytochrome oxidase subunit 3
VKPAPSTDLIAWIAVIFSIVLIVMTLWLIASQGTQELRELIAAGAVLLAGAIGIAVIACAFNPARKHAGPPPEI